MKFPLSIRSTDANPDLAQLSIVYDLRRISMTEGLRAAIALASMVVLARALDQPLLVESALAALLACLADPGGPVPQRTPWLAAFAISGALVTAAFGLLRGQPLWLLAPAATVMVAALQMMRLYGQAATQLGNLLTVVLVLAIDRPENWQHALQLGAAFGVGGAWALVLTLVLWPVRPFQPVRAAVAACWNALAAMAADLRDLAAQPNTDIQAWEDHARGHRRAVRVAIEAAQQAMLATVRQRGRPAGPDSAVIRLEAAEQAFGALIALSDLLEENAALRPPAEKLLRVLRPFCVVLADATRAGAALRAPRVTQPLRRLSQLTEAMPGGSASLARRILDRVQIAALLAVPDGFVTASGAPRRQGLRVRLLQPLAANLTPGSVPARHALRAATVFLPAFAWTVIHPTSYGHWLTITLVLTLQPFMALTWQRALERIGGTLTGGVIAALLSGVVVGPLALTVATFPLAVLCFAFRPAGFGLMVTFLTPLVVLLSELGRPDQSELVIALMRALYTLIGGLLGVGAGLLLWPAREPPRLRRALQAALLAHASWAEAEDHAAEPARRVAGRATVELETSLSRALLETGRSASRLQAALAVDAALRRLAGRLTALHLAGTQAHAAWLAWRAWTATALRALAADHPAPPPPDIADDSLTRLARQVELIDGAMARFRQAQPA